LAHCQTGRRTYKLLVGTYTGSSEKDGLFVYEFDSKTGDVRAVSKVSGEENPSYLAISTDSKFVYAVNEVNVGKVSSFRFNEKKGDLRFINRVSSGGVNPCFISVDNKNKYVFTGNYGNGTLSAIPLNEDGSLRNDLQIIREEGYGIDPQRQKGPHVHCTVLSPDNNFLFSANLGTDKISAYRFEASKTSNPLTPANPVFTLVEGGSGPRHFTFHPNGQFAYLITELSGKIIAYDYNNGRLTEKQRITMASTDGGRRVDAADIHVSPDGSFLYASCRGNLNEIVIYSLNKSGEIDLVGRQQTLGQTPRNFAIDPSGNFLLVANQNSDEIIIFRRDPKTGLLTPSGKSIKLNQPVCLKFCK
jgi:6-phosphogluconolactonase